MLHIGSFTIPNSDPRISTYVDSTPLLKRWESRNQRASTRSVHDAAANKGTAASTATMHGSDSQRQPPRGGGAKHALAPAAAAEEAGAALAARSALRSRLKRDGYLFFKKVLDRQLVLQVRDIVIGTVDELWNAVDVKRGTLRQAFVKTAKSGGDETPPKRREGFLLTGFTSIVEHPKTLQLLESRRLMEIVAPLLCSHDINARRDMNDDDVDDTRENNNTERTPLHQQHSSQTQKLEGTVLPPRAAASNPACVAHTTSTCIQHRNKRTKTGAICEQSNACGCLHSHAPSSCSVATFRNKWIRVKATGENTDEHTDFYRFSRYACVSSGDSEEADGEGRSCGGAGNEEDTAETVSSCCCGALTCWVPLGDYDPHEGVLAMCRGSHLLDGYREEVYDTDLKRELPPAFDEAYAKDAEWVLGRVEAGDMLVFDLRLVHASTTNSTDRFRVSADTRWCKTDALPDSARKSFRIFSP